ncbi:MAG TPA: hypothetical protein VK856_01820 [Anaerolineaceae bacterium]|nr:hypothetical protein [Anaerolineaceae bacterium]
MIREFGIIIAPYLTIMETQIFHTLGLAKIQRTRMFTGRGDVLVKVGQKVDALDPIAEFVPEEKFQIINIKKELNLKNIEDARRSINVKIGDKLHRGDIVARSQGIFSKTVVAQTDSEVINIIGSQIIVRVTQPTKPVIAGFDSIVTEILPFRGVVIETNGALIQGVWGNQKATSGQLTANMDDIFEELTPEKIDVTYRGSIVLGGYCSKVEVLKAAEELNIKGLILSSMSASLATAAINCSIPIILLEGFGPIPLNERAFELLKSNEGKLISLNAIYDPKQSEKPEIIIQMPVEGDQPSESLTIKPGRVVRINNGNYQGRAAVIKKINETKTKLSNGIRTNCAIVELNDEDMISIPLANLDILE